MRQWFIRRLVKTGDEEKRDLRREIRNRDYKLIFNISIIKPRNQDSELS